MADYDDFKARADPETLAAIEILEHRGFVFGTHFGILNAIDRLEAMDRAIARGELYEHLRRRMGILVRTWNDAGDQ